MLIIGLNCTSPSQENKLRSLNKGLEHPDRFSELVKWLEMDARGPVLSLLRLHISLGTASSNEVIMF